MKNETKHNKYLLSYHFSSRYHHYFDTNHVYYECTLSIYILSSEYKTYLLKIINFYLLDKKSD